MGETKAPTAETPLAEGAETPLADGEGPSVAVGGWVRYCLKDGFRIGEWRPALVVRVGAGGEVNLQVFTDGPNDYLPCPLWVESALRGELPGQWSN